VNAWTEATATAEAEDRAVTAQDVRAAVRHLEPTPEPAPMPEASRMAVHFSSATDEWATPPAFFDAVAREFDFTLDVCALDSSAKCARYFTPDTDGLAQTWDGVCWMNPPYGDVIGAWVEKAAASAAAGATVVALLPARVDTGWWWNHVRHHEVRFLRGRLKFGGSPNSAPFPSALVVFGYPAGVVWWTPDYSDEVLDVAA
jgi:phage N-6-adenine-methyltransferase